jgi:hypothetical protein
MTRRQPDTARCPGAKAGPMRGGFLVTHASPWLCPLCGSDNSALSTVCRQCLYWADSPRPDWARPGQASTERPLRAPLSDASPDLDRWDLAAAQAASARPLARGPIRRDWVAGSIRVVWAALGAGAILASAVGFGWWLGLGQSRPLAADLQVAEQTITHLEAQLATRPAAPPPPFAHAATGSVSAAPAVWTVSGTFSPELAMTVPVVLVNPANGRRVATQAEIDTGSFVSLIAPSVARALGLQDMAAASIVGVAGSGRSEVVSGFWIETPTGRVLWRLGGSETAPTGGVAPVLLGRDVLNAAGVSLTTQGDAWQLRLTRTSIPAEGAPPAAAVTPPPSVPSPLPPSGSPAPATPSCPTGQYWTNGQCSPICESGWTYADGQCVPASNATAPGRRRGTEAASPDVSTAS